MDAAMDRVHAMADAGTVVGAPILTPDGVTLTPVSRVSFGFVTGGSDHSDATVKPSVLAGSSAGVKIEPLGFLVVKDGSARMLSIQPPAMTTADHLLDLIPEVMEKVEGYVDKYGKKNKKSAPQ